MFPEMATHMAAHYFISCEWFGATNLGESEMENKKGVFADSSRVSEMCHIHHMAPHK
jgi:hypothetical protein